MLLVHDVVTALRTTEEYNENSCTKVNTMSLSCGSTVTFQVRLTLDLLVSGAAGLVVIFEQPLSFNMVVMLSIRMSNSLRFAADRDAGLVGVRAHDRSIVGWLATNDSQLDFVRVGRVDRNSGNVADHSFEAVRVTDIPMFAVTSAAPPLT